MGDRCAQALGFDFYRFCNRDLLTHRPIWLHVNPLTTATAANAIDFEWTARGRAHGFGTGIPIISVDVDFYPYPEVPFASRGRASGLFGKVL